MIGGCDPQEPVSAKESLLNDSALPSRANGWILTPLQLIFGGVFVCAGNREWLALPESCLELGAGLPVQTNAERAGSTHPELLWHFTWVFALCKFWPNKTNCSFILFHVIYLFISLSLKTTQEGQSKSTFCLFAVCNARLGGRRCSASSVKDRNTAQPSAAPRGEPSALAFRGCIVDAVALCGMGHAFQTQI